MHDQNMFSLSPSMDPVVIGKFRLLVLEKLRPLLALAREAVPNVELEMQYRRATAASMCNIPGNMDYKDGFILLSILYRSGGDCIK